MKHDRLSQFKFAYEHSEYFEKGHIRSKWLEFLNVEGRFWQSKPEYIAMPKWRMPLLGYVFSAIVLILIIVGIFFGKGIWQFTKQLWHHNAETSIDEPTSAINLANVIAEPDFPTKAEALKNLATPPQGTALTVQNRVARPLKLMLFNCFAHYYSSNSDSNLRRVPFIEVPLPPATESGPGLQPFSKFPPKFSYYGIYVIDSKNGAMTKVGFVDFSSRSDWFLRINESGNSLVPEWTDGP